MTLGIDKFLTDLENFFGKSVDCKNPVSITI